MKLCVECLCSCCWFCSDMDQNSRLVDQNGKQVASYWDIGNWVIPLVRPKINHTRKVYDGVSTMLPLAIQQEG